MSHHLDPCDTGRASTSTTCSLIASPRVDSPSVPSTASSPVVFGSSLPSTSHDYEEPKELPEESSHEKLEDLLSMFPSTPPEGIKFLFKISNHDAVAVTDCLIGVNVESIIDLLRPAFIRDNPKRLRLDEEDWESDDDLAESLVAFYKDSKFNPHAAIRVCIPNQPVIDTGGARRQLFSRVLSVMAQSEKFGLFEGPPGRLRPTFKQSSVSSGMLLILGRMIGHSLIMDKQGFPFLSPPCYYYMCGYFDKALSLIQQDDIGDRISHVITQVVEIISSK